MKSEGGNRAGEELWGKHSGKLLIMLYLPNVSSISQALNEALNPATPLGSICMHTSVHSSDVFMWSKTYS